MNNLTEAYVPDSHSIVWRFEDSSRLPATVQALFDAVERDEVRFIVPTIVLGELLSLSERRRPSLPLQAILDKLSSLNSVTFAPLDLPVFTEMRKLPASIELHDRAIVATAISYGATLITTDRALVGLTKSVW